MLKCNKGTQMETTQGDFLPMIGADLMSFSSYRWRRADSTIRQHVSILDVNQSPNISGLPAQVLTLCGKHCFYIVLIKLNTLQHQKHCGIFCTNVFHFLCFH